MIKLDYIKPGDTLYCINISDEDPIIEEYKVNSINHKKPFLVSESEKFYTYTISKNNEIRYIRIKPRVYDYNREVGYSNRYQMFHSKKCKPTYVNDDFLCGHVYPDEINQYIISFERDYLIATYIKEHEDNIEYIENEIAVHQRDLERSQNIIKKLKQL